ncbi:GLUCOSE-6-PHOSPHATE 1-DEHYDROGENASE G6PD [Salix purpurea]|uniref:glucose-6-phosphate dehydrogenase (NADP(+)) n=1 Tax=Salix purpurea TaxID=77065 RepID=A0A9Q1A120_SALPP|nr:GLUCOSE-6-PHOSPHATE 1-DEHYDROGENASE G6PD [Salix purpurea]
MGSGQWMVERRSSFGNDSFPKEHETVSESGCLSIIVLGASGDLAKKKTFPALYHLYRQGFLDSNEVHIFGYARTKISDDDLRDRIRGYLGKDAEHVSKFLQLIKYVSGSYDSEDGFQLLDKEISQHEESKKKIYNPKNLPVIFHSKQCIICYYKRCVVCYFKIKDK